MLTAIKQATTEIYGARIYYEVRGSGPSVVLVPGAGGDGGYLEPLAEALSDEFTVVSYDRRGNSRSPRPAAWNETSNDEQAADLTGLIGQLGIGPVAALGSSVGAIITLFAVLEHPEAFRGVIPHEPPLFSVLEEPDEVMAPLLSMIEQAMAEGGPRRAMEAFADFVAGESLRALPGEVVDRMLGNAETFFGLEFGRLESWRPDEDGLTSLSIPIVPAAGVESPPFFREAARWIADRVAREVVSTPGAHVSMIDRPAEFAEAVRPLLRQMS